MAFGYSDLEFFMIFACMKKSRQLFTNSKVCAIYEPSELNENKRKSCTNSATTDQIDSVLYQQKYQKVIFEKI